jgi:hypothetical protein
MFGVGPVFLILFRWFSCFSLAWFLDDTLKSFVPFSEFLHYPFNITFIIKFRGKFIKENILILILSRWDLFLLLFFLLVSSFKIEVCSRCYCGLLTWWPRVFNKVNIAQIKWDLLSFFFTFLELVNLILLLLYCNTLFRFYLRGS